MPTSLLNLPELEVAFETRTNESWRDSVAFATAGSIVAVPSPSNVGSALPVDLTVRAGAYIGEHTLTFIDPNSFVLKNPDEYVVGAGTVFAPFEGEGISFRIPVGITPFAQGDTITLAVLPKPIDLTGIRFVLQVRDSIVPEFVLAEADTDDGTMVGEADKGVIGLAVPLEVMANVAPSPPGSPYDVECVAIADGDQRVCMTGKVTVARGKVIPRPVT